MILKNLPKLKDKTNSQGDYYHIRPQLPEPLLSEKMDRERKLKAIRKANTQLPEESIHQKVDAYIKGKTLYVNKKPQRQHIFPLTVQEMFNITAEEQRKIDAIELSQSDVIVDKGGSFKGFALKVNGATEIRLAYKKLRQLYPESNHIMLAYTGKAYTGSQDDGEYTAGYKLLNILSASTRKNTALFVTREYGVVHLGPRRFLHIEKVAREAMQKLYPF